MNLSRHVWAAALLVTGLAVVLPARAGGDPAELDCAANARLFDSHFGRYGYLPQRSIIREARGLRFWLPAQTKGVSQTGLYSYFVLAGDFEVSATYELLALPPPQGGYGVFLGIGAETEGPGGNVSLVRGHWPEQGSNYALICGRASAGGPLQYETTFFPTSSRSGRLLLRREKAEAVGLVADGPGEPPRELCRVPFTGGTVRSVRLFADPGGSPTALDARLSGVVVRAEEITGGVPKREARGRGGWWLLGAAALAVVAALSLLVARRKWRQARTS
ncbi:MAG TPA: hypothetical protein VKA46_34805 [Gemmataceae bacterium]|nr:hypothetical protein [Gemmataceae bacterium]